MGPSRIPGDEELFHRPDSRIEDERLTALGREAGEHPELDGLGDTGFDDVDPDGVGEPELESDGGPEDEAAFAASEEQVGRPKANARIQAVLERERQQVERNNQLERELMELRARQEQIARQQQQVSEEERLAQLPWEQQVEHRLRTAEQQNRQELQRLQFQNVVTQDKMAFETKAAADPNRRRMSQAVEATYFQAINTGRYIPREDVYAYLIGKEVLERQAAAPKRRTQAPSAQRQNVRAPNTGSNQSAGRRGGNESLAARETRLGDITF